MVVGGLIYLLLLLRETLRGKIEDDKTEVMHQRIKLIIRDRFLTTNLDLSLPAMAVLCSHARRQVPLRISTPVFQVKEEHRTAGYAQ